MNDLTVQIEPIRPWNMPAITRMVYANMTGVDERFTQLTRGLLGRWLGYGLLPAYLWFSGDGYKALVAGELVGCAYLYRRQLSGYVFNVSVNKRYRRYGIGRMLMNHLEEAVQREGLDWVALHVDKDNTPALTLYHNLGYQQYHPYYLQRVAQGPLPEVSVELRLQPIDRQWRSTYRELLAIERREGDEWAAQVVGREYSPPMPVGGRHWQPYWRDEAVGYVWFNETRPARFLFLFYPRFWGHPVTLHIIASLQQQFGADLLSQFDLHLGSQSHFEKAAVALEAYGFEHQSLPRILMLKRPGDGRS